jgi:hypothetical protein
MQLFFAVLDTTPDTPFGRLLVLLAIATTFIWATALATWIMLSLGAAVEAIAERKLFAFVYGAIHSLGACTAVWIFVSSYVAKLQKMGGLFLFLQIAALGATLYSFLKKDIIEEGPKDLGETNSASAAKAWNLKKSAFVALFFLVLVVAVTHFSSSKPAPNPSSLISVAEDRRMAPAVEKQAVDKVTFKEAEADLTNAGPPKPNISATRPHTVVEQPVAFHLAVPPVTGTTQPPPLQSTSATTKYVGGDIFSSNHRMRYEAARAKEAQHNFNAAVEDYRFIAERGFPEGLFGLGQAHLRSAGLEFNKPRGMAMVFRAAYAGVPDAQLEAAKLLMNQPRQQVSALKWALLAAQSLLPEAEQLSDKIRGEMLTKDQADEAEVLAREWKLWPLDSEKPFADVPQ